MPLSKPTMTHHTTCSLPRLQPLLVAAWLACAAAQAPAADFSFAGVTDSGSLLGSPFSGSFSYDMPAAGFDGSAVLSAFSLSFAGQAYTLASAEAGSTPLAWFTAGSFVGVDYQSGAAADPTVRPQVSLVAGFTQFSEASLAYSTSGAGVEGFGSYTVTAAAPVPEPGGWLLMLGGLTAAGTIGRRRWRAAQLG
jgi:hypothetical protein